MIWVNLTTNEIKLDSQVRLDLGWNFTSRSSLNFQNARFHTEIIFLINNSISFCQTKIFHMEIINVKLMRHRKFIVLKKRKKNISSREKVKKMRIDLKYFATQ